MPKAIKGNAGRKPPEPSDNLARPPFPDGTTPTALIATDGELYGHHHVFRELFLEHLLVPTPADAQARTYDTVLLSEVMVEPADQPFAVARILERTSWSCHHGVARWSAECPDATDGRWKGPLRAALDRLAAGIDAVSLGLLKASGVGLDFWAARDAYIEVVSGAEDRNSFARRQLGARVAKNDERQLIELLEAQRWRLAMFASDGWYWEDPAPRTSSLLRGRSGSWTHWPAPGWRSRSPPTSRYSARRPAGWTEQSCIAWRSNRSANRARSSRQPTVRRMIARPSCTTTTGG